MKHEQRRAPVTALAYGKDGIILTGKGNHVNLYRVETRQILADVSIFKSQIVHGICAGTGAADYVALVWGNRLFRAISVANTSEGGSEVGLGATCEAQDWILDASLCPFSVSDQAARAALVTAHNALLICDINCRTLSIEFQEQVPRSNCILYSASVTWLSRDHCLVASGTAFGDIIVWSCKIVESAGDIATTCQTHYVFSAHQGSVFGVTISSGEEASALGSHERILASCSDDRTIRLWDISDLSVESPSLLDLQRQTGFGSVPTQEVAGPRCLATVMGHISRIWHVRFALGHSTGRDQLHVLSYGEDASCIAWSVETNPQSESTPFILKQLGAQRAHTGKHIWSVNHSPSLQIATGGSDGAIALATHVSNVWQSTETEIDRVILGSMSKEDNFKVYNFMAQDQLFATTEQGRTLILMLDKSGEAVLEHVTDALPGLRGYSVIAAVPASIFFAGTSGEVFCYYRPSNVVSTIAATARKVSGLFAHQPATHQESSAGHTYLLITNVGSNVATLLQMNQKPDAADKQAPLVTRSAQIQLPEGFIVTSFVLHAAGQNLHPIVGSRNGSIALYTLPADQTHDAITSPQIYPAIHGDETITSFKIITSLDVASETITLLSTGRNGTFAAHRLTLSNGDTRLDTVHQLSLPFGPNIEGLDTGPQGQIWAWGFRSKQFIVYDVVAQREIMAVVCGGMHRNWAFKAAPGGGTFVWTKASKLYYTTQCRQPFEIIDPGGHGREIKAVSISQGATQIIATGAEDTDIRLSTYVGTQLKCLHTLQKHNTGIQHLHWSADGQRLFSSGGIEEFYVWKISHGVPLLGVGVICESAHPNCGTSDLRIMNFGVLEYAGPGIERSFTITMAYSNSALKQWRYSDKQWTLLAEGSYLTTCLTQCMYIGSGKALLTGGTDGHITTWTTKNGVLNDDQGSKAFDRPSHSQIASLDWKCRYPIHQSAILAAAATNLPDGSTLLLTGGDDNAIGVTILSSSFQQGTTDAPRTLLLTRAHAAAVTALAFLPTASSIAPTESHETGLTLPFVSAGLDQRVKTWELKIDLSSLAGAASLGVMIDEKTLAVQKISDEFTAVADVAALDVVRLAPCDETKGKGSTEATEDIGVCVCGVGVDIWRYE